jgi:endonuclease-3 related protein
LKKRKPSAISHQLSEHVAVQSPISNLQNRLFALYNALHTHFGHEPHWWPLYSDTPQFEILVGAVLVQQTRWETVEAAVVRLLDVGLLSPAAFAAADTETLAVLIRPCAFHTQKAPGLQAICRYLLTRYDGDVGALLAQERAIARAELLALPRIGPETADTIMLYAGDHPVFVVDAYARRLFSRLDIAPGFDFQRASYDAVQRLIEDALALEDWRLQQGSGIRGQGSGTLWQHNAAPDPATSATVLPTAIEIKDCRSQSLIPNLQSPTSPYTHLDGSLRHFLWDFHALIVEECIHHCLAANPRQDTPGARRTFVDPRKCATHCLDCRGCPLREMCATYQHGTRNGGSAEGAEGRQRQRRKK